MGERTPGQGTWSKSPCPSGVGDHPAIQLVLWKKEIAENRHVDEDISRSSRQWPRLKEDRERVGSREAKALFKSGWKGRRVTA
jgi:hypothetical protein